MGVTDEVDGNRGCGCPDLVPDIIDGVTVIIVLQVGDEGDDPTHWEGVGRIPTQGDPQADGESTLAREVWSVDIPPSGGRDGEDGTAGGGDLRLPPP